VKIVFCLYNLRQKWIDLRQAKIEMISSPFYIHIPSNTFTSGNASVSWYLSAIIR